MCESPDLLTIGHEGGTGLACVLKAVIFARVNYRLQTHEFTHCIFPSVRPTCPHSRRRSRTTTAEGCTCGCRTGTRHWHRFGSLSRSNIFSVWDTSLQRNGPHELGQTFVGTSVSEKSQKPRNWNLKTGSAGRRSIKAFQTGTFYICRCGGFLCSTVL